MEIKRLYSAQFCLNPDTKFALAFTVAGKAGYLSTRDDVKRNENFLSQVYHWVEHVAGFKDEATGENAGEYWDALKPKFLAYIGRQPLPTTFPEPVKEALIKEACNLIENLTKVYFNHALRDTLARDAANMVEVTGLPKA